MSNSLFSIVLLTDATTVNLIIKSALDPEQFSVQIVKSSDPDFFEQIAEIKPDLVFLKTELSQANGIEVCDKIKQDKELKSTKVVFLSSNHNIREQAIQHRADRFIIIPFKRPDVEKVVEILTEKQKRILYVDDSDLFHKLVVPALKEEGYEVFEAWDGREGLEILDEEGAVDLILSDVEMPEMDGLAFCRNVRKSMVEDIPFVLVTSLGTEESVAQGFEAGADDYILKPIVLPELLSRVKRLLSANDADDVSRPERVLVVDDSEIIRNIIVKSLQTHGFAVDEAEHGIEALAKLRERKYHLLITDYEMPHLDGVELCLKLREKSSEFKNLPIIFATSRDSRTDLVKMSSIGIQAFVAKPFDADRIIAETERVLAESTLTIQKTQFNQFFQGSQVSRAVDPHTKEEYLSDDQYRTILSTGILGFPALCREMPSVELVAMLNRYFDRMAEILDSVDAMVDKYNEDRIFTSFGSQAEGAGRAIQAAQKMIEALPALNKKNGHQIKIQVGIHSGHVILGQLGAKPLGRRLTLIGENIQNCAAIKSLAGGNEIFLSKSTVDLVGDKVKVEAVDKKIQVGEKEEPLFRLV
ncbi:MAG: response regulator [Magnetococcales bacterium]|nr:response regulator [Magnetococcales bacterium]